MTRLLPPWLRACAQVFVSTGSPGFAARMPGHQKPTAVALPSESFGCAGSAAYRACRSVFRGKMSMPQEHPRARKPY